MFIGHPFYVSINCESIITKQWNETRISTRRGIGWVEWLAWQKKRKKERNNFLFKCEIAFKFCQSSSKNGWLGIINWGSKDLQIRSKKILFD